MNCEKGVTSGFVGKVTRVNLNRDPVTHEIVTVNTRAVLLSGEWTIDCINELSDEHRDEIVQEALQKLKGHLELERSCLSIDDLDLASIRVCHDNEVCIMTTIKEDARAKVRLKEIEKELRNFMKRGDCFQFDRDDAAKLKNALEQINQVLENA